MSQRKRIVLAVVMAAVLYVLISPLPELSANSPRDTVAIALGILMFCLVPTALPLAIRLGPGQMVKRGFPDLQAALCSRQC